MPRPKRQRAPRAPDLVGRRFGYLTVLRRNGRKGRNAGWLCRCICGFEKTVGADDLRRGQVASCARGHYNRPLIRVVAPEECHIWYAMHQRCYNKLNTGYRNYGARGVRVHKRWHHLENFISDMGPRPSPLHSLDRYPDNDGDYAPSNCRWATKKEQSRNTRRNIYVQTRGKKVAVADFANQLGLTAVIVRKRLYRGWTLDEALSLPAGKHKARANPEDIVVKIPIDNT